MGTKRPHPSSSSSSYQPPIHASRQANFPPSETHPHKRARKTHDSTANPASLNHLKRKIRDTTRLLQHAEDLPAGVRIEQERALAGYKQDLEAVEEGKSRAKMIKRYHMVRFFGR